MGEARNKIIKKIIDKVSKLSASELVELCEHLEDKFNVRRY